MNEEKRSPRVTMDHSITFAELPEHLRNLHKLHQRALITSVEFAGCVDEYMTLLRQRDAYQQCIDEARDDIIRYEKGLNNVNKLLDMS